jgi:hypothetical protein
LRKVTRALHGILDHRLARPRGLQADDEGRVGVVGFGHVAPGAEEQGGAALGLGGIAEGLDFFLRGKHL